MLRVQVRDIFLQDMAMVKAQQVNMDLRPTPAPVGENSQLCSSATWTAAC